MNDLERAYADMCHEARVMGDYERRYRKVLYETYTGLYTLADELSARGCVDEGNLVHEQARAIHAMWHAAELTDAPVQLEMFATTA